MFLATSFTSSFVFARLQSAFTFFQSDALAFTILGLEDKRSAKPSENVADRVGMQPGTCEAADGISSMRFFTYIPVSEIDIPCCYFCVEFIK